MRRLTIGLRAGSAAPNTRQTRPRGGVAPTLCAAVLALSLCALATPELHAATTVPRDATRSAPTTLANRRLAGAAHGTAASTQRKADCSAYFNAMFGAMDQLDQAWALFETNEGSPLLDMAAEGYVIWATDGVAAAQSQLESCLSG
jgi:hypothetical protein